MRHAHERTSRIESEFTSLEDHLSMPTLTQEDLSRKSPNIGQVFPEQPMLMPMVHVRHRDGKEDRRALALMEEVVARRVTHTVCASGVIKMLALASGGHIRRFSAPGP